MWINYGNILLIQLENFILLLKMDGQQPVSAAVFTGSAVMKHPNFQLPLNLYGKASDRFNQGHVHKGSLQVAFLTT